MNNQLLLSINSWAGKSNLLDNIMIFCASYLVYFIFAVIAVLTMYWIRRREWKLLTYFYATLVVTYGLLQAISLLNFDHRPFMDYHLTQLVAHASGKSFPSDHTTVTAGIALVLLFFTKFKKLGILFIFVACLIGFARIFVGIHYPLDIAGGLITGLLGGSVVLVAKKIIDTKNTERGIASSDQTE